MALFRWVLPAFVPALLAALIAYRTDRQREPLWLVAITFAAGAVLAYGAFLVESRASAWTGLTTQTSVTGESGALLFLFALVAPLREAAKVLATWPAFRSRYFDEPYDGILYASMASLGFASVENAIFLKYADESVGIAFARTGLALPAHVFFAATWGYTLGRSKQNKTTSGLFPVAWLASVAAHGLYMHLVYGRGPGALIGVLPLLLAMAGFTLVASRDLKARGDRSSRIPFSNRLTPVSIEYLSGPPSLRKVREELRRADHPLAPGWVIVGALVTLGSMFAGLGLALVVAHVAHVDFSGVDEHDVSTTAPVALLGLGLLVAFPVSGYLVARASGLVTLLEPALGSALAIVLTLVLLGMAAPLALVFALAFSPIAWGLACAGAWAGRSGISSSP